MEYVVGQLINVNGYMQLPINESCIIDRCVTDPKYFKANYNLLAKEPEMKEQLINSLYHFIVGAKSQFFIKKTKKDFHLIVRINPEYCIVIDTDLKASLGVSNDKKNSFIFTDTLEYSTVVGKTLKLKKKDQYQGTLKSFFDTYGTMFNMDNGNLMLDSI